MTNKNFLKIFLGIVLSLYFGSIIAQSSIMAGTFLLIGIFIFIFLTKIEFTFYFLLASRTLIDVYFEASKGGVRISYLVGFGIITLFLFYIIVVSRFSYSIFDIFRLNLNKIYALFLVLSVPAIFLGDNLLYGFGYWVRFILIFAILNLTILIVLMAGAGNYKKRIKMISLSVVVSILFPIGLFISNYVKGVSVVVAGDITKYTVFGAHYNVFAYLLFLVFSFCLFLYSISEKKWEKMLYVVLLAFMLYLTYVIQTRNIWIAVTVLLLVWNILRKNFKIVFSLVIIVVMSFFIVPAVYERMRDVFEVLSGTSFFDLDPRLGSMRVGVWQGQIRYFLEQSTLINWLFGNGFDVHFKVQVPPYNIIVESHNNYLYLLMTTGVFALSAYMAFLFTILKQSVWLLRRTRETFQQNLAQVTISLIFAYLAMSMLTHVMVFLTLQMYFLVFGGFVIAANIFEKASGSIAESDRELRRTL